VLGDGLNGIARLGQDAPMEPDAPKVLPPESWVERHQGKLVLTSLSLLVAAAIAASRRPWVGVPALAVMLPAVGLLFRYLGRLGGARFEERLNRLRAVAAPQGDAWKRLLEAQGLGRSIPGLMPLARAAIRLATARSDTIAIGASKIGGDPDLPRDLAWPDRAGPMEFLAQIDLAEAAAAVPTRLPASGHLWFFLRAGAWGGKPAHDGLVLYAAHAVELASRTFPGASPPRQTPKSCALSLTGYEDVPGNFYSPAILGPDAEEHEVEAYFEVRNYLSDAGGSSHKLLGHDDPVQDSVLEEARLVAKDDAEWILLLQLDTDDRAGMMWGDAGMLYFCIRADDLDARRFDRTLLIMQCH
jgi:uncharacterized protein YwqG